MTHVRQKGVLKMFLISLVSLAQTIGNRLTQTPLLAQTIGNQLTQTPLLAQTTGNQLTQTPLLAQTTGSQARTAIAIQLRHRARNKIYYIVPHLALFYRGCGEKCNFSGGGQKCLDARRPQTREEAYLNGTLTKQVCGQRRRWAFFTTPIELATYDRAKVPYPYLRLPDECA